MNTTNQGYPHQTTIAAGQTRAPQTLHEHFRADPRGADSFGEWIEARIWELLQRSAQIEFVCDSGNVRRFHSWAWVPSVGVINPKTAAECILAVTEDWVLKVAPRRIVVPDGTVLKEWAGDI